MFASFLRGVCKNMSIDGQIWLVVKAVKRKESFEKWFNHDLPKTFKSIVNSAGILGIVLNEQLKACVLKLSEKSKNGGWWYLAEITLYSQDAVCLFHSLVPPIKSPSIVLRLANTLLSLVWILLTPYLSISFPSAITIYQWQTMPTTFITLTKFLGPSFLNFWTVILFTKKRRLYRLFK